MVKGKTAGTVGLHDVAGQAEQERVGEQSCAQGKQGDLGLQTLQVGRGNAAEKFPAVNGCPGRKEKMVRRTD